MKIATYRILFASLTVIGAVLFSLIPMYPVAHALAGWLFGYGAAGIIVFGK